MSGPRPRAITLRATHVDLRGDGVGVTGGRVVHVPGLFGGESAQVRVLVRSARHPRDTAEIDHLRVRHRARREAPCHRHVSREGACSGCPLMELDEDAQRDQKRLMLAALGLSVDRVAFGAPLGYRASSKRVAFMEGAHLRLGSWARGTHVGADMRGCLVDHPRITRAADELAREANVLGVRAYDEARGEGVLRYVLLKTDGERVLMTLITGALEDAETVRALAARLEVPAGVSWSVQPSRGNAIRGEMAELVRGVDRLDGSIADVDVPIGPLGFLQPNPAVIGAAYRALLDDEEGRPLEGARALDLYAGAGVTTALARARFREVVPCESHPESAAALGVAPTLVEELLQRELASGAASPALVIANPPRKGLGPAVCEALIALGAPRVHVMSCGPEGLARDLAALEAGGYRRVALEAYDTLPQTPHVELVAKLVLSR